MQPDLNLEGQWDEVAPQLSTILEGNTEVDSNAVPFDPASDVPIDEQKYVIKYSFVVLCYFYFDFSVYKWERDTKPLKNQYLDQF